MQTQVMVRRRLQNNTNELILASVLSEDGDTLRVKMEGRHYPETVKKSDTLSISNVAPGHVRITREQLVTVPRKSYPDWTGTFVGR